MLIRVRVTCTFLALHVTIIIKCCYVLTLLSAEKATENKNRHRPHGAFSQVGHTDANQLIAQLII